MYVRNSLNYIPLSLIITRFLLAVFLLNDAMDGTTNIWFTIGLSIGILSDIVDGMIARKLDIVTSHLRDLDSRVDFIFLMCILASAYIAHGNLLVSYIPQMTFMMIIYAISIIFPLLKFGRLPSYHAYSAKISALILFAAGVEIFSFSRTSLLLNIALIAMIIGHLDRILITAQLPESVQDIDGFWKARNFPETK